MKSLWLPLSVLLFVALNLAMVQLKVNPPMLLAERFIPGAGWIEIIVVSLYGALIAFKMQDPLKVAKWRTLSWTIFMVWFFTQLLLGMAVDSRFLLTGKLHIPVPALLIAGPIFRSEISFMTILFLSTILLTGPSWCSHLCYFGAADNLFSRATPTAQTPLKHPWKIKLSILLLVVVGTLVLRWFHISYFWATAFGIGFGVVGLGVSLFISKRQGKMVHCTAFCPVGTVVSILKHLNPFRLKIDQNCTSCMQCTTVCKYNALNTIDIKNHRAGVSCTLCGDCLSSCHSSSLNYTFWGLSPSKARTLYLFLTISTHAIFLAMGRI